MKLIVTNPKDARLIIHTTDINDEYNFKFKFNPKVNSKVFNKTGHIQRKDMSSAYSIGNDNATIVAKWLLRSKETELLPFTLNFWPNPENGQTLVTIDYELTN